MNFSIGGREGVQNDQSRCLISWHSWRSFFINKAKKNVFLGGQMKNGKKAFFRKMLEASAKLPTKTSHQYPQFLRKGLFFWKFFSQTKNHQIERSAPFCWNYQTTHQWSFQSRCNTTKSNRIFFSEMSQI